MHWKEAQPPGREIKRESGHVWLECPRCKYAIIDDVDDITGERITDYFTLHMQTNHPEVTDVHRS